MCRVIITQPNYIPWKGYFSPMRKIDYLVMYDDVQYTKRDWRNRNYLIGNNGPELLTIPVITKGKFSQKINETKISDHNWNKKHWKFIYLNYKKSKYFYKYSDIFEDLFMSIDTELLSEINITFIKKIVELLNINIKILKSSDFNVSGDRNEKLLKICKLLNTKTYISGPSAKSYIDEGLFKKNDLLIEYNSYHNFKVYNQMWNGFDHNVSIVDMLFNLGEKTIDYFNET